MGRVQTLRDIWTDRYPPKNPRQCSIIEKLFFSFVTALTFLSLSGLKPAFGRYKHAFMDTYVLIWTLLISVVLFIWPFSTPVALAIAAYRILDIVSYRLFFLLVKSQDQPWTPDILRRSILIVVLNFYECIVSFAILYLGTASVRDSAGAALKEPFDAFYFSLVTMTTVGYGDYFPASTTGRAIAACELTTVIVFVAFVLPALVAVFSTELSQNGLGKRQS